MVDGGGRSDARASNHLFSLLTALYMTSPGVGRGT